MDTAAYLAHVHADTARLVAATRSGPDRLVTACPGWTVSRLAGHVGRVHRMAAAAVRERLVAPPDGLPRPPEGTAALIEWIEAGSAELTAALSAAAPDDPAWNFTDEAQQASFWPRRMALETAVHRWDAESAVGDAAPIDTVLAVDGMDEYLSRIVPRAGRDRPPVSLGGSLHLHATDAPGEWMVQIEDGRLSVEHGHGKGDAAVRATASDLLLAAWARRSPLADPGFELFGDRAVAERFFAIGGN